MKTTSELDKYIIRIPYAAQKPLLMMKREQGIKFI